mmetsp:Transcript_17903/g.26519  ORF Transcript_17903/g.26519 Transcript_17903/m.26519 type:complete len:628 (+) Transcript_17903:20-1903(+)
MHPSACYLFSDQLQNAAPKDVADCKKFSDAMKSMEISNEIKAMSCIMNLSRPDKKLQQLDELINANRLLKIAESECEIRKSKEGDKGPGVINISNEKFCWSDIERYLYFPAAPWSFELDVFLLRLVDRHGPPTVRTLKQALENPDLPKPANHEGEIQPPLLQKRLKLLLSALLKLEGQVFPPQLLPMNKNIAPGNRLKESFMEHIQANVIASINRFGVPLALLKRGGSEYVVPASPGSDHLQKFIRLSWQDLAHHSKIHEVRSVEIVTKMILQAALRYIGAKDSEFQIDLMCNYNSQIGAPSNFTVLAGYTDPSMLLQNIARITRTRDVLLRNGTRISHITSLFSRLSRSVYSYRMNLNWWAPHVHDSSLVVHSLIHGSTEGDVPKLLHAKVFEFASMLDSESPGNVPWRPSEMPQIFPLSYFKPSITPKQAWERLKMLQNSIAQNAYLDVPIIIQPPPTNYANAMIAMTNNFVDGKGPTISTLPSPKQDAVVLPQNQNTMDGNILPRVQAQGVANMNVVPWRIESKAEVETSDQANTKVEAAAEDAKKETNKFVFSEGILPPWRQQAEQGKKDDEVIESRLGLVEGDSPPWRLPEKDKAGNGLESEKKAEVEGITEGNSIPGISEN